MSTPTCATVEVQRMDYLEIPLRNGKTVRDGKPVPMHFKIRAVVGGDQDNLENSDKKDRLHSDGEGLGDHASGFLALGGEWERKEICLERKWDAPNTQMCMMERVRPILLYVAIVFMDQG